MVLLYNHKITDRNVRRTRAVNIQLLFPFNTGVGRSEKNTGAEYRDIKFMKERYRPPKT